ncbi:hypothetical protein Nepgr_026023 [Nepenthes gracilis]|uniref:Secreted protein n=1 Tax=Nepenthes gracilis TaxID=150966 RepID=A0AAD3Y1N9_NEPGR|nr:hypothetical protein Nepgr_026023 [Nepenthes gracilis]
MLSAFLCCWILVDLEVGGVGVGASLEACCSCSTGSGSWCIPCLGPTWLLVLCIAMPDESDQYFIPAPSPVGCLMASLYYVST